MTFLQKATKDAPDLKEKIDGLIERMLETPRSPYMPDWKELWDSAPHH